jgi:hypothetical protein
MTAQHLALEDLVEQGDTAAIVSWLGPRIRLTPSEWHIGDEESYNEGHEAGYAQGHDDGHVGGTEDATAETQTAVIGVLAELLGDENPELLAAFADEVDAL